MSPKIYDLVKSTEYNFGFGRIKAETKSNPKYVFFFAENETETECLIGHYR